MADPLGPPHGRYRHLIGESTPTPPAQGPPVILNGRHGVSYQTMLIVLLMLSVGSFGLMTLRSIEALQATIGTGISIRAQQTEVMHRDHQEMGEGIEGLAYILSLPPEQRPKLAVPKAVRRWIAEVEIAETIREGSDYRSNRPERGFRPR